MFPNTLEHRNNHPNAGNIQFSQITAEILEDPDVSSLITPSKTQLEPINSENVISIPNFLWSIFLIFPEGVFFFSVSVFPYRD